MPKLVTPENVNIPLKRLMPAVKGLIKHLAITGECLPKVFPGVLLAHITNVCCCNNSQWEGSVAGEGSVGGEGSAGCGGCVGGIVMSYL